MTDLLAELKHSIATGLQSNTLTSCSRWAAFRRVMGEPFPGPYTWKYHPWVKEMHDCNSPFAYAMKGAQLGVTEVAINRAFYALDQLKRDVLYVLPNSLIASDFSKARFGTALRQSPYLNSIFTDTNTVGLKQAGTTNLYIRGSRGEGNLVSIPVSVMVLDEVDRMDQSQIWLALERLSGQIHKSVWGISTPTLPNYGIHKLYQTSTQERFIFKCPRCSRKTELIWPDCVEICGESVTDPRVKESFLKCKECGGKLNHETKPEWLADAEWVSTAPNADKDVRGFHISQLYSFTVSPAELVTAYFRGIGDEAAAVEFHNSKLGVPYISDSSKITDEILDSCLGTHTMQEAAKFNRSKIITLGVDQGKTNYYAVCEWTFDKMSNDLVESAHCKVLAVGRFMDEQWGMLNELMPSYQVLMCVIDADPNINEARRFARKFLGYVNLCRYRRGQVNKEMSISEAETGSPIATVDRTNWLSVTMNMFRTKRVSLPVDTPMDFRDQMKNQVRTYLKDPDGNMQAAFVETGPDHFYHAMTYACVALPLAASIQSGSNVEKFL